MRDEIASLQQANAQQQQVIDQQGRHAQELKQTIAHKSSIIEHVKEVLGRHFVALESDAVKMEFIHSFIRWPRRMDIGMAFNLMGDEAMAQVLEDMVLYPIDTKLGELREEVAVRVVTPCGDAAMYVSQGALMRMSDDRLRRTLIQDVADQLALHIVKIRKQGDQNRWPPRNY
jgi:hypothetical protein